MNPWKPIAICSLTGLLLTIGTQISLAGGGTADRTPAPGGVCHDQVNMAAAAATLRAARGSLEKAEHNKGGWRTAAIEATNKAIAETDRGCAFADTH